MFSSCETTLNLNPDTTEKIVYNFYDSSVPPEYHRSFEILITHVNASILVDSYGDTLATATKSLTENEFNDFIELVNDAKLTDSKPKNELACSGSTSESLKIYSDKLELNTHLDHCQVDEFPSNSGNVRQVIDKMKDFFPDLKDLLK